MSRVTYQTIGARRLFADLSLEHARTNFGFVPNLLLPMAVKPATLDCYLQMLAVVGKTSLTQIEQQIVMELRENTVLSDPKLAALQRFTRLLVAERGQVSTEEIERLLKAGYTRATLVAVSFIAAVKCFPNFLAHLAQTEIGPELIA